MLAKAKKLVAAMTKTQMLANISESTELTKKQVGSVFDALEGLGRGKSLERIAMAVAHSV